MPVPVPLPVPAPSRSLLRFGKERAQAKAQAQARILSGIMLHKRSYLLLEVLLALSLLSLCLIPLLKPFFVIRSWEKRQMQHLQWEQVAGQAFCFLGREIMEKKYSDSELKRGFSGVCENFSIYLDAEHKKSIPCYYTVTSLDWSHKRDAREALVLDVRISFSPKQSENITYHFSLYVENA